MSDIFDPFEIDPTPEPEDEAPEDKSPEVPEEPVVLSEDLFAPDLPVRQEQKNAIIPEEHKSSELGHFSLSEEDVPKKNKLIVVKPNIPANTTAEQKRLVDGAVRDVILHGAQAAAMVCRGEGDMTGKSCPYLEKCPLYRHNVDLPLGDECPVELAALATWTQAYMRELNINPYDVSNAYDSQSAIIMAGLNLQIHRARWGEALNPILEQTITNTLPGDIVNTIKVGNYNTDYRDKAIKQIAKIARDSMQTRERKVSLLKSGFNDMSKHSADVHERLERLEKIDVLSIEESVEIDKDNLITKLSRIKYYDTPDEDKV